MSKLIALKLQIAELQDRIRKIQEQCRHPEICLDKVHKSNTGNYDPSADCYWTEFTCGLCEKFWTEDGSK